MRIAIDVTIANTPPLSGVGYHIVRLLEALDATAPAEMEFRLLYAANDADARARAARDLPASRRMRPVAVPFLRGVRGAQEAHWRALLPLAIHAQRCAVFHGPAHILPRVRGVPTVVTIHDLAFFEHELYTSSFTRTLREAVSRSLARATAVIAVSEYTRADIARLTGRTGGVHVIHNAGNYADPSQAAPGPDDAEALKGLGIENRYVLYVGDFNPRKNLPYLIESFARLRRQYTDVQLVLAGNPAGAAETIRAEATARGLTDQAVIVTGRVSDALLPVLYRQASAFALCSVLEGFPLVTLEAMSYGVPVVMTDVGPAREETGAAAELVPLGEPDAVARALTVALTPSRRREEMRRLGLERIHAFTWEAAASRTIAAYEATAMARHSSRDGHSS